MKSNLILREIEGDFAWEKSMFSMPFIPHLNGSRSTQVSRLLHTSVHHAPHLCGLSTDYRWGLGVKKQRDEKKHWKQYLKVTHQSVCSLGRNDVFCCKEQLIPLGVILNASESEQ